MFRRHLRISLVHGSAGDHNWCINSSAARVLYDLTLKDSRDHPVTDQENLESPARPRIGPTRKRPARILPPSPLNGSPLDRRNRRVPQHDGWTSSCQMCSPRLMDAGRAHGYAAFFPQGMCPSCGVRIAACSLPPALIQSNPSSRRETQNRVCSSFISNAIQCRRRGEWSHVDRSRQSTNTKCSDKQTG